mmetsp:Transcript_20794/g.37216  ORF Transcript_20794/g.37216 Transcript_20794/m.37216 type:complete len:264 (-) Transcript_20794:328-1119(-)
MACQKEGLDLVAQLSFESRGPLLIVFLDSVKDSIQDIGARTSAFGTGNALLPALTEVIDEISIELADKGSETEPLRDGEVFAVGAKDTTVGLLHHRKVKDREDLVAFLRGQAQNSLTNDLKSEKAKLLLDVEGFTTFLKSLDLIAKSRCTLVCNNDDIIENICSQSRAHKNTLLLPESTISSNKASSENGKKRMITKLQILLINLVTGLKNSLKGLRLMNDNRPGSQNATLDNGSQRTSYPLLHNIPSCHILSIGFKNFKNMT